MSNFHFSLENDPKGRLLEDFFFSPERRSKVVKFTKNDRLNALIVLARDERFSFFPWKWSKGGTIGRFYPHFLALWNFIIQEMWQRDQTFSWNIRKTFTWNSSVALLSLTCFHTFPDNFFLPKLGTFFTGHRFFFSNTQKLRHATNRKVSDLKQNSQR